MHNVLTLQWRQPVAGGWGCGRERERACQCPLKGAGIRGSPLITWDLGQAPDSPASPPVPAPAGWLQARWMVTSSTQTAWPERRASSHRANGTVPLSRSRALAEAQGDAPGLCRSQGRHSTLWWALVTGTEPDTQ